MLPRVRRGNSPNPLIISIGTEECCRVPRARLKASLPSLQRSRRASVVLDEGSSGRGVDLTMAMDGPTHYQATAAHPSHTLCSSPHTVQFLSALLSISFLQG